jgi:tRNA pseudouridine32 synthase/23S rRNA pseudouridine746 synthase
MTNLPANIHIPIVFEHADFVVINKPAGIVMHDAKYGIIALFSIQYPDIKWHLVHRLDTETSGCLLLAKSSLAAAAMSQLFAERSIDKYYLAISDKIPKKKQGLVKGDMKKARGGNLMLTSSNENPAITQFFSASLRAGLRAFICKPHTGKTHQIRVALKSLGSSILGDARYGKSAADRMYLHSFALCFSYQGEHIEVYCPPADGRLFTDLVWPESWSTPQTLPWPPIKALRLKKQGLNEQA